VEAWIVYDRGCRLPARETGNTTDISEYTAETGNVIIRIIILILGRGIAPPQTPFPVVFDGIIGINPYY